MSSLRGCYCRIQLQYLSFRLREQEEKEWVKEEQSDKLREQREKESAQISLPFFSMFSWLFLIKVDKNEFAARMLLPHSIAILVF